MRFALINRGHNYDFDSYQIVAAAKRQGLTAWQTDRYNYGPVWWHFLRAFDWAQTHFGIGFRYQIVGVLTIADLSISYFIYKFKGLLLGTLFFINPISIIISGYHNQFDNLAIALACFAILKLANAKKENLKLSHAAIILLLGISLATKHVFLFFVIWIAVRQKTFLLKCMYFIGPLLVFAASFAPYVASSWESIKLNVIDYRSFNNAPLWKLIGIYDGDRNQIANVLFVVVVTVFGFVLQKVRLENSLLVYCIVIVAFSPGIANQYLAIATIGAIGLFNAGFAMFVVYGAFWLTISPDGLRLAQESQIVEWAIISVPGLQELVAIGYGSFPILLICGLMVYLSKSRSNAKLQASDA